MSSEKDSPTWLIIEIHLPIQFKSSKYTWNSHFDLVPLSGPVNKLLSWPVLVPFSRLTYMAYLVHPIIMEWYYQSRRTALYLDDVAVVSYWNPPSVSHQII